MQRKRNAERDNNAHMHQPSHTAGDIPSSDLDPPPDHHIRRSTSTALAPMPFIYPIQGVGHAALPPPPSLINLLEQISRAHETFRTSLNGRGGLETDSIQLRRYANFLRRSSSLHSAHPSLALDSNPSLTFALPSAIASLPDFGSRLPRSSTTTAVPNGKSTLSDPHARPPESLQGHSANSPQHAKHPQTEEEILLDGRSGTRRMERGMVDTLERCVR